MSKLRRIWNRFSDLDTLWGIITSDAIRPYAIAAGTWALTMLSALATEVPIPYLIAASCFAAACVVTALLRADEWWTRINPSGKLAFVSPFFGYDVAERGNQFVLEKVQFGMNISNKANYPIVYEVESIDTRFDGRVSVHSTFAKRPLETSPDTIGTYRDDVIAVNIPVDDYSKSGRLKFRITYYKNPRKKFVIEKDVHILAKMKAGEPSIHWEYNLA